MVSDTPILDLPQELITRVSSYLTTVEFGNFRRSCRSIERYLFHGFTQEFFTKRQFLIEHESLQALDDIASHDGLNLRDVIIDTRIFNPENTGDHVRLMEGRHRSGCLPRAQLLYTGKALDMLSVIFSKLRGLRSIGIRDFSAFGRYRDSRGPNWDGWGATWNPWGWTNASEARYPMLQHSQSDILPLILSALAKAHNHPEKLEVVLRGPHKLGRNAFLIEEDTQMSNLLDNLKTVMLDIGPEAEKAREYITVSMSSDPKDRATTLYFLPLLRFLHRLHSVEHLRLNWISKMTFGAVVLEWLAGKSLSIGDGLHTGSREVFNAPRESINTLELGSLLVGHELLIRVLVSFRNLKSFALWRISLEADTKGISKSDNLWPLFLTELSHQLPKTRAISNVLIGHVGQEMQEQYGDVEIAGIVWNERPKEEWKSSRKIEYDKQSSTHDVHGWLVSVSTLNKITSVYEGARGDMSSFGESEDEEDFEFDEDDEEFDEDDDDEYLIGLF